MRYVVDIDGTICIPGPTDETRYDQALPIQDRIDEINKLYDEGHTIINIKVSCRFSKMKFIIFTSPQTQLYFSKLVKFLSCQVCIIFMPTHSSGS